MKRLRNFLSVSLIVLCSIGGCSGSGSNKPSEDTRSKVEYFRDTQGPTVTPHGKIKMESVEEAQDGRIQYQTEDGKKWRVEMTKQADGKYLYGTPDEVK